MIISIISIIALSIFLFSMDLSWSNVISSQRNDLVFEGRNTSYGAYALRKEHHVNLFYALLTAVGLIGGSMFAVGLFKEEPAVAPNPSDHSVVIPFNILPIERTETKEEKKPELERKSQKAAGQNNNEVEVVEAKAAPLASDLDRRDKQQGGDGEDPVTIAEPYVEPKGGGDGDAPAVVEKKKARRYVKHPPRFPGGEDKMMEYMLPRVKYSEREIDRNVEGIIYISFVVNEDGSISEAFIERGIRNGERLADKAIEAIYDMPRWIPGDDGEEPLPVIVTMPLNFKLRN